MSQSAFIMAEHIDVNHLLSRSAPEVYSRLSMAEEAATSLASQLSSSPGSSSSAAQSQDRTQWQHLTDAKPLGVMLLSAVFSPYLMILLSYFALIFYLLNRVITRSILRRNSGKVISREKTHVASGHSIAATGKAKKAALQPPPVASNANDGDGQMVMLKMREQSFRTCLYAALAALSLGTTWLQ